MMAGAIKGFISTISGLLMAMASEPGPQPQQHPGLHLVMIGKEVKGSKISFKFDIKNNQNLITIQYNENSILVG